MYLVFSSRFLVSGPETLLCYNLEKTHIYHDIRLCEGIGGDELAVCSTE